MREISFNTVSRVIDTIKANPTANLAGVQLHKVEEAACNYSRFFRFIVNFLSIESGKQYYNRIDQCKKVFAVRVLLKLQRVNDNTKKIFIDLPGNGTVYKIEISEISDDQLECTIDGISQGIINGTLMGLRDHSMRRMKRF